jgi:DNA-binding GntR family transcriptional regulator/pimeloyl-ACP methyl ester carboxylesterase
VTRMDGQRRASDVAYQHLRDRILDHRLRPGERIDSQSLSDEMGISRMPVKQALDRLAAEGLLDVQPNRGTFVATPSLRQVEEAFEVRIGLELLAAARTVGNLSAERLAAFNASLDELDALVDDADPVRHMEANERFHTQLVDYADNATLSELYRTLRTHIQIAQIHYSAPGWESRREQERAEHRAIYAALSERDADALQRELEAHLRRAEHSLIADIRRAGDRVPGDDDTASAPVVAALAAEVVDLDGSPVASWRQGSGPDLLLLHGYGCSSADWAGVAQTLAARWRIIRFDFPAHGASGGRSPRDVAALAALVGAACRELCAAPPVVVGHSMGGMAALEHVLGAPDTVAGLVLADAFPHLPSVTEVLGESEQPLDPFGYGSVFDHTTPPHVAAFVRAEMEAGVRRAGERLFDSLVAYDARERLSSLAVPTQLLLGDRRWVHERDVARVVARLGLAAAPQLSTALLQSHHFVMLEQPVATAEAIDRFATSIHVPTSADHASR